LHWWPPNRLELSRDTAAKYYKIAHHAAAIEALFVDILVEAHTRPEPAYHSRPVRRPHLDRRIREQ